MSGGGTRWGGPAGGSRTGDDDVMWWHDRTSSRINISPHLHHRCRCQQRWRRAARVRLRTMAGAGFFTILSLCAQ